jgi:peptidoglycan/LPS O-acetylase OafA/YrhL
MRAFLWLVDVVPSRSSRSVEKESEVEDYGAQTRYAAYQRVRMFGSLDGLRCLCLAMVLWHHGVWADIEGAPIILARGFTGVDFFFVLSGFLITTLLLREETESGRISLGAFYRRRFFRIVPVYFLAVTVIGFYWVVLKGEQHYLSMLPYYYFFIANFLHEPIGLLAPMWSLAVEEQYYLVWPLMLLLIPPTARGRVAVLVCLITLCFLVSQGILPRLHVWPSNELAQFDLPVGSYSAILVGSLLSIVLRSPSGYGFLWLITGWRWAPVVYLAATFASLQVLPPILRGWPNLILHGLMALTLASLVVREDHAMKSVMQNRLIKRVGHISYGTYIWHLCGRHVGSELSLALGLEGFVGQISLMITFVLSSILIGEVSYRFFESYFLRLKDKSPKRAVRGGNPPIFRGRQK